MLPKLTKSKEYKHMSALFSTEHRFGSWPCKDAFSFHQNRHTRAILTDIILNRWHHHRLITQARDTGITFHFSSSLIHSPWVIKSIILLPGFVPIQSFFCEPLSPPWLGSFTFLPWAIALPFYLTSSPSIFIPASFIHSTIWGAKLPNYILLVALGWNLNPDTS